MKGSVLAGLVVVCISSFTNGAVVFSDNFDAYTNHVIVGQGGWAQTGATTTAAIQIAGGSDKYVQITASGQDVWKAFTSSVTKTDGESLHTSIQINVTTPKTGGDFFAHLSSPAGTTSDFYQRLFVRSATGGYQLGLVDTSGTGSTPTYGATVLSTDTDYDVDITWNFVPGTKNDTFALTVDGANYLTHTWTSALAEPTTIEAVNLRQGSSTAGPFVAVDDYFVETIIPEPAAVAMLAVGALGMLARRRRA